MRLTHLIERLGKTADIGKPVHPHVLRHTFATRAAARGVDPLMLADQLGHTTLTMVRRYIQLSGQQQAGQGIESGRSGSRPPSSVTIRLETEAESAKSV